MALSTAIKNKMLAVYDLEYLPSVEIENEDGNWIDFSDRADARSLAQLRLSTDKSPNKLVSSISAIVLDNEDNYFNDMDDPADATTAATWGTLASKFLNGFRNKNVRLGLNMKLDNDSWETTYLGIYRIKDIFIDDINSTAKLKLAPDVDFLKVIGTETISHGKRQHLNKPVSYLVPEILKKVYPEGVGSNFDLPSCIYLETHDGNPTFSHYGKPPEYDPDTSRWRDDITKKPTAIYYDGTNFYFGIENEIWKFDPSTEEYDYLGAFTSPDMYARAIYPFETGYLFVLGIEKGHLTRYDASRSGVITIATPTFTENSAGWGLFLFTGEFVWRESVFSGLPQQCYFGNITNAGYGASSGMIGVNMPVPIPQCVYFTQDDTDDKSIGFDPNGGLQSEPAADKFEGFPSATYIKKTFGEAGYLTFFVDYTPGTYPDAPGCQVYWGMKKNFAAGDTNGWGYCIFVVESDGVQGGVNNSGETWFEWTSMRGGNHSTISENNYSGADAHIYGLSLTEVAGIDTLYWINVNWIESFDSTPPLTATPPTFYIKRGQLTDSGGDPYLADSDISTQWTAGDDDFAADDSLYAPIVVFPVYDTGIGSIFYIVVMLDMDDIGGTCYKLFFVTSWSGTFVELGESYYGWSNFVFDGDDEYVYFIERDTGRVCYIDVSDYPSSNPSDYSVIGDGFEPVSQSLWEMPNDDGLILERDGSTTYVYGVQYPSLPGYAQEDDVWPEGKYYFWKYHKEITDRVELFDMDRNNAYDALGHLAEAVNYMIGVNPDGTGFFSAKPTSSASSAFTIDLDSAIGRHFTLSKGTGYEEIVNRSVFIPYEATAGEPEATLDLVGRIAGGGTQEYFNGQTEVKSDTLIEKNIILHCIRAGDIGTAVFKYRVYEFQISTALREDVSGGDLDLIRLDSNQDVAVDMLVQVGNYEGASGGMHVDVIEADGDIDLSENLDEAYDKGTAVIFREAEHGKWSTEYATPDDYTALSTWGEIGDTGLYLKFSEDDVSAAPFCIGDRITIHNPGLELQRSRTKKYQTENKTSIDAYGLKERNFDNPYMSISLGMERVDIMVADDDNPRHSWKLDCPLFLDARPLRVLTIRGTRALPTATDNEEKVYVRQVSHDFGRGRTVLTLKGLSDY